MVDGAGGVNEAASGAAGSVDWAPYDTKIRGDGDRDGAAPYTAAVVCVEDPGGDVSSEETTARDDETDGDGAVVVVLSEGGDDTKKDVADTKDGTGADADGDRALFGSPDRVLPSVDVNGWT
jgi:hypothetical protein